MRTHYCNEINLSLNDQTTTLCGWVHRRRDHGGLIFVDLRDREGIVQIVFDPAQGDLFETAQSLRNEYVIEVTGTVRPRPEGTVNPNMPSGEVELLANSLVVHNTTHKLPFNVDEYQDVGENTRLLHRHIDLRRPEMSQRIKLRAKACHILREYLEAQGFLDIETPILTKATPEGARDYLVPSRHSPGKFYALPQSPQIFKQLLMIAGFDRYYQITRCFRDEDLRADRQPEFTQLDIEMSFINENDIQSLMEKMIRHLFKATIDVDLVDPFPHITYADAMLKYGTDRPDLRIPLELTELTPMMKEVEFKVFHSAANDPNGRVAALHIPNGAKHLSRKQIDDYGKFVGIYGAKGLAYIKVNQLDQGMAGLQSPILKFLDETTVQAILEKVSAKDNSIIFFGADNTRTVSEALGALRVKVAQDLDLIEDSWRPAWIVDFPMFEQDSQGNWQALHHPFTAPNINDAGQLKSNPGQSLSRAYDMVINGSEVGGGSIRIHHNDMQQAVFEILGIDTDKANDKFGHLLRALQHGCPPHGGIAFGVDRLISMMTQVSSIREVIAFPKTQTGHCPLTNAPSHADFAQLHELGITVNQPNKEE